MIVRRESTIISYNGPFDQALIENLNKPRRQRQGERRQTTGLMSITMAVHVRFKSLYISLPSSTKQQRKNTKFCIFWKTRMTRAKFWFFLFGIDHFRVSLCLCFKMSLSV